MVRCCSGLWVGGQMLLTSLGGWSMLLKFVGAQCCSGLLVGCPCCSDLWVGGQMLLESV